MFFMDLRDKQIWLNHHEIGVVYQSTIYSSFTGKGFIFSTNKVDKEEMYLTYEWLRIYRK